MTRVGLILLAGATLFSVAACSANGGKDAADAARPSAMGADFALTSQSITLPVDANETFPAGPHADAMEANCRACHSPSMILVQPPLSHDDWAKEVDKMRSVYKASVAEEDVPAILAYLDDYSARQGTGN